MKWFSHKIITGITVYCISGDPFGAAISALGSIVPDKIEGQDYKNFNRQTHRKISHWFILYAVPMLGFFLYICCKKGKIPYLPNLYPSFLSNQALLISTVFFYFLLGCIFHLIEDSITGKIPLLNPHKKEFGIRLIKVGSLLEYATTGVIMVGFLLWLKLTYR